MLLRCTTACPSLPYEQPLDGQKDLHRCSMGFNSSKYATARVVSSVGVHRTLFVDDVMIS